MCPLYRSGWHAKAIRMECVWCLKPVDKGEKKVVLTAEDDEVLLDVEIHLECWRKMHPKPADWMSVRIFEEPPSSFEANVF